MKSTKVRSSLVSRELLALWLLASYTISSNCSKRAQPNLQSRLTTTSPASAITNAASVSTPRRHPASSHWTRPSAEWSSISQAVSLSCIPCSCVSFSAMDRKYKYRIERLEDHQEILARERRVHWHPCYIMWALGEKPFLLRAVSWLSPKTMSSPEIILI